jgi:hypothetical protein
MDLHRSLRHHRVCDYVVVGEKQTMKGEIIAVIMFVFLTIILFINNLTQVFNNLNFPFNINIISWIGIGISLLWLGGWYYFQEK